MLLVLYLTLLEVAFGMSAVLLFIPRPALGPGFGKTISSIVFFCLLGPILLVRYMLPSARPDLLTPIQVTGGLSLLFWFLYFVSLNFERDSLQRKLSALATSAQIITSASGLSYGSGRSMMPSTTLKIAVVAPMPSASVSTAANANAGRCDKTRRA